MGSEPFLLDPEVEALLRECAADPSSKLLRVPRPMRLESFTERVSNVGPATPGLSAAEREIVEVHREEVAYLLRQAAWYLLAEVGDSTVPLGRTDGQNRVMHGVRPTEIHDGLQQARTRRELDAEAANIIEVIGHALSGRPATWPSVTELAAVAVRLVPNDHSRLHAATALARSGEMIAAQSALDAILATEVERVVAAEAWTCVGVMRMQLGRFADAYAAYRRADDLVPMWNVSLFGQITSSCQADLVQELERACSRFDQADVVDEHLVAVLARRRRFGTWRVASEAVQLARSTAESAGPAARRILDVLVGEDD